LSNRPSARFIHRDRIGTGTVYFTSIRKEKGVPFTVRESEFYFVFVFLLIQICLLVRFKVICDNGTILNIVDSVPNEST